MPAPPRQPESLPQRDERLAAGGVPICPQCGERDMVRFIRGHAWCERCTGYLSNLEPPAGRHVPDF